MNPDLKCPADCQQDRARFLSDITDLWRCSTPTWLRNLFVSCIAVLFVLYAGNFAYAAGRYQTREGAMADQEKMHERLLRMEDKLDRVLERLPAG